MKTKLFIYTRDPVEERIDPLKKNIRNDAFFETGNDLASSFPIEGLSKVARNQDKSRHMKRIDRKIEVFIPTLLINKKLQ